jgi:AcrR family transcriptional regulator
MTDLNAETLSTRDWLDAAKTLLIREGVESVKIDRIARECGVTRGGFYWRFRGRSDLLAQLLEEWSRTNTAPLLDVLAAEGPVSERFAAAASLWINEEEFDPRFDAAVRNWALTSSEAAQAVRAVDALRINAFYRLFLDAGLSDDEALVRARITYFHQIGYYTLHIAESAEERRRLSTLYYKVLTGFPEFAAPSAGARR